MKEDGVIEGTGYSVMIHISALIFSFLWAGSVPILNIIVPLVLWLVKKDNAFIDFHGREAVRFQVFFTIYALLFFVLIFVTFGFAIFLAIPLGVVFFAIEILFPIIAAVKAADGKHYCYPLTFSPRRSALKTA
jgi:uncharacterized protein